jgi:hypothetical protein
MIAGRVGSELFRLLLAAATGGAHRDRERPGSRGVEGEVKAAPGEASEILVECC